jgi:hypothetical protein
LAIFGDLLYAQGVMTAPSGQGGIAGGKKKAGFSFSSTFFHTFQFS